MVVTAIPTMLVHGINEAAKALIDWVEFMTWQWYIV